MSEVRRVLLHQNGSALWPSHKPLYEILGLKLVTPPQIWETTYMLNPQVPGGTILKSRWYANGRSRYHPRDPKYRKGGSNGVIKRWVSIDSAHTATKKGWEQSQSQPAYTAFGVWDLLNDYRLVLRYVWRARLEFPDLLPSPIDGSLGAVAEFVDPWYDEDIFAGVLVEDADSGTAILQTLRRASFAWAGDLMLSFVPDVDKITRAILASAWMMNGSVLLPLPDASTADWQHEYEEEIFGFPNVTFKDQVDMTTQIILWTANRYLAEGLAAREAMGEHNFAQPWTREYG